MQVGFYQVAKLLIIPFVCIVELVWLKKTFTLPVVASVLTVVTGVAIVWVCSPRDPPPPLERLPWQGARRACDVPNMTQWWHPGQPPHLPPPLPCPLFLRLLAAAR